MKLILLNAPPRAGKDTASDLGVEILDQHTVGDLAYALQRKFASPLYNAVGALFALSPSFWADLYNNHKDEPSEHLMGMSPREAMIWMSEDVAKPKFGKGFFGKIAAKDVDRIKAHHIVEPTDNFVVFFSDCGFAEEVVEVVNQHGAEDCVLVRIERSGCSYVSDSRSYIKPEDVGIPDDNFFIVENNGTLDDLATRIQEVLEISSKG